MQRVQNKQSGFSQENLQSAFTWPLSPQPRCRPSLSSTSSIWFHYIISNTDTTSPSNTTEEEICSFDFRWTVPLHEIKGLHSCLELTRVEVNMTKNDGQDSDSSSLPWSVTEVWWFRVHVSKCRRWKASSFNTWRQRGLFTSSSRRNEKVHVHIIQEYVFIQMHSWNKDVLGILETGTDSGSHQLWK